MGSGFDLQWEGGKRGLCRIPPSGSSKDEMGSILFIHSFKQYIICISDVPTTGLNAWDMAFNRTHRLLVVKELQTTSIQRKEMSNRTLKFYLGKWPPNDHLPWQLHILMWVKSDQYDKGGRSIYSLGFVHIRNGTYPPLPLRTFQLTGGLTWWQTKKREGT